MLGWKIRKAQAKDEGPHQNSTRFPGTYFIGSIMLLMHICSKALCMCINRPIRQTISWIKYMWLVRLRVPEGVQAVHLKLEETQGRNQTLERDIRRPQEMLQASQGGYLQVHHGEMRARGTTILRRGSSFGV